MKTLRHHFKFVMFIAILSMLPFVVSAQSYRLKAYELSYKYINEWGRWTNWSKWEACNIDIAFNYDNSRIIIFSKQTQDYSISTYLDPITDNNGKSDVMKCIDKNGLVCTIRVRTQYNPKGLQLYVEYQDMVWVYNIEIY